MPLIIDCLFALLLLATAAILIASSVTNAPYLPSDKKSVEKMMALARIRAGEKIADLGSGDGRILIAMAKAGAEAHGYELNLFLVWWSRWNIRRQNLSGKAFVHWKSFWSANLGQFDVVTMFTLPYFMNRLGRKIKTEMKSDARFISNGSPLPNMDYASKNTENGIYLYNMHE